MQANAYFQQQLEMQSPYYQQQQCLYLYYYDTSTDEKLI